MKLREFEQLAHEYWEEIPEDYKRGIDGVRVLRRSKAHDDLPDIYTLGECLTETYPSEYGGPDTIRSAVVLYHGSFAALAELDPEFEWEDELWETLTHELRHHLESLADEDALEDVDYAADENFKRYEGEAFDPFFHRSGELVPPEQRPSTLRVGGASIALTTWRVDSDWFLEATYASAKVPAGAATFDWLGARHAFELPTPSADVTFAILDGDAFEPVEPEDRRVDEVALVLVRRTSAWRAAIDALRRRAPTVEEIALEVTSTSERSDA